MVDNEQTIYLECLWQRACGGKKYRQFFGLPLTVYIRHPLRFSVGHRVHNKQMTTGWTSLHPKSLADRDDSKNNILIESAGANYAKHNFSDEQCGQLHDHFKTINIPLQYYDPSIRDDDFSSRPREIEVTEDMLIMADDVGPVGEDSSEASDDEGDDGSDDAPSSSFPSTPPRSQETNLVQAVVGDPKIRKPGQLSVKVGEYFELIEMNESGRYFSIYVITQLLTYS
jgi:hypothetical protein